MKNGEKSVELYLVVLSLLFWHFRRLRPEGRKFKACLGNLVRVWLTIKRKENQNIWHGYS